jgi:hypothetical protein
MAADVVVVEHDVVLVEATDSGDRTVERILA